MAGEWAESSLDDLIEIKHGFAFSGEYFRDEPPGDILLTPGNFAIGGGFKADKFKYYNGAVPEEFVLHEGDLLVTMTDLSKQADTLGYSAFVPAAPAGRRFLHNQRLGKVVVKDEKAIDLRYLHYLMRSQAYRHEVLASATGTTVKHTSPERIKRFRFMRPPLSEQRAIAHILGTLDDKIELNRRVNETLEAMARAIFKSWFVDFDPIRAKMEGRLPRGMSPEIAALFPDSFQDSRMGKIPEKWGVATLEQVCVRVTRGVTPKYEEGSGRFIINQRVNRGHELDWSSLKELSPELEVPNEQMAKQFDVLVNCLGEGTLGRVHFFTGDSDAFAIDQHMSICRSPTAALAAYIYHVLSSPEGQARIEASKTGSTGMTMFNISKLRTFDITIPDDQILDVLGERVLPLYRKIQGNREESGILEQLREGLLPKLLSGAVRVKDAEKLAEQAS